ncbi:lamin tail domain-containing protein [Actinoplanes sp. NPDC051411]|uniref:lamin tail domain-containing protein n=1 Tax=Actinoplanes sp. NPDC051411 TaxID=3155522 RepID=UPI003419E835
MNSKLLIPLVAAAATTGLAVTAVPAEAATPSVTFSKVYVNSPGSDNRSNTSLNAEWVLLRNNTAKSIQLKGWTVRDRSAHVYTFGSFSLGGKKTVYVHTGKGTNTSANRYWGSGNYIWNNDGDAATLRNSSNATVDSCSWKTVSASVNC